MTNNSTRLVNGRLEFSENLLVRITHTSRVAIKNPVNKSVSPKTIKAAQNKFSKGVERIKSNFEKMIKNSKEVNISKIVAKEFDASKLLDDGTIVNF
ncbi:MAG: hypothetical protein ACI4L6_01200 [Candidatus Onthoplasma sp.]